MHDFPDDYSGCTKCAALPGEEPACVPPEQWKPKGTP